MPEIIVFIISLAAAIRGADWVGRSAIAFAKQNGVSPVVIGATIVSLATTLPELSVAFISSILNNDSNVALGVVLGSPLVNLGLILGLLFFFSDQRPKLGYFSRSINLFIVISLLLLVVSLNQEIGGLISILLIILGSLYLTLEYIINKRFQTLEIRLQTRLESIFSLLSFTREKSFYWEFLIGAFLLGIGSKYLADTTVAIATLLQINQFLLSITLLAVGTSLPELITTLNSIIYKRYDLSIGNLVGASVLDLTIGVGAATVFHSGTLFFPNNFIIFSALIIIGVFSLFSLWKKIPLVFSGSLILVTGFFFLVLFSLANFS